MSLSKIAKIAGVSISTVSRVLNKPELVSKESREKILSIAKEVGYTKYSSHSLEISKKNEIGIILPNLVNSFFSTILEGMLAQAKKFDLPATVYLSNDDKDEELDIIHRLIEQGVKGIILIRAKNQEKESIRSIQILNKYKVPFVLVDRDTSKNEHSGVFLSNAQSVFDVIDLLLKKGYKNIPIIAGPDTNINSIQRLEGYKKALNKHGLILDESMVFKDDFSIENGFNITTKILESKMKCDIIFSSSNNVTVGAIKAINSKGLILGKDVKLFSFIQLDASHISNFDISYIEHPAKNMGEKSVVILKNKLVGTKGTIREILEYNIHFSY